MSGKQQQQMFIAAVAATALTSFIVYLAIRNTKKESTRSKLKRIESDPSLGKKAPSRGLPSSSPTTPADSIRKQKKDKTDSDETPLVSNTSDEKSLHLRIEELDKKGKGLFKSKKFVDAAEAFTEALDMIEAYGGSKGSTSLHRQIITLTNNRSAMYEKAGLPDLALEDCRTILSMEVTHQKARTRKLRILEAQKKYGEALVEVCVLQLRFMQENRDKLRMGLPVNPPVPQSKLEELVKYLVPPEVEKYQAENNARTEKPLPSNHTLMSLLKSFDGFEAWMARAAKDGTVAKLTTSLESAKTDAEKASCYMKRGRRHSYEKNFEAAVVDFEAGYSLVKNNPQVGEMMADDDYARLLEWTGMAKHWKYDLDNSLTCYETCSDLEPMNAGLLVKRAGVKMDGSKHEEALTLFDMALGLDPNTADALLHRANLRMMQMKPDEATVDLEACLKLRPNNVLARLRLATIMMNTNNIAGAKVQLDKAGKIDPNSSDVHSYKGELCFLEQNMVEAKKEFEKAIECDEGNPTPYVNSALAIMNTMPSPGQTPDIPTALRQLEKAIEVDPQFHAAYSQLGQLKLSLATDLDAAREVVKLYDKAIQYCRTTDELREIVNMRVLTVAQIDAATELGMEKFTLQ